MPAYARAWFAVLFERLLVQSDRFLVTLHGHFGFVDSPSEIGFVSLGG